MDKVTFRSEDKKGKLIEKVNFLPEFRAVIFHLTGGKATQTETKTSKKLD